MFFNKKGALLNVILKFVSSFNRFIIQRSRCKKRPEIPKGSVSVSWRDGDEFRGSHCHTVEFIYLSYVHMACTVQFLVNLCDVFFITQENILSLILSLFTLTLHQCIKQLCSAIFTCLSYNLDILSPDNGEYCCGCRWFVYLTVAFVLFMKMRGTFSENLCITVYIK